MQLARFCSLLHLNCVAPLYRYVRLNRNRLKGERGVADTAVALAVLYEVLMTMVRLMAPVTPFLTEYMYQHLRNFHPGRNSTAEPETAVGRAVRACQAASL